MEIRLAESAEDIAACFPVMASLRPDLSQADFVGRVQAQQARGYHLVCLSIGTGPAAVAGFWLRENLAWGRHLYVDDLVALPNHRSEGHGAALLRWLEDFAAKSGCGQLHLDSGTQRVDAHRFYLREGMTMSSYHFVKEIEPA